MRFHLAATSKTLTLALFILLLGVGVSAAQQQVNLIASPSSVTLPDGSNVPMWGYFCGTGSTGCSALNSHAGSSWSPVVITVPTGTDLQINLTNQLIFGGNKIPTSFVIVGQIGGGLGSSAVYKPSPAHENMGTTWPIADTGPVFVPPKQGDRVQSFATEVAAGATTQLTWKSPRPGTYLIESGTHPSIQGPMGLYGILVVTSSPSGGSTGTAYPGVSYNAEIPLLFSEIDPIQNKAISTAVNKVGFDESAIHGPYSPEPIGSLNLLSPGSGYTSAPTINFIGGGGSGAAAHAVVDTDSTSATYGQITEIDLDNAGSGYTSAPSVTFTGGSGSGAAADTALQLAKNTAAVCSNGAAACYPPVVNYTPLYYLINGVAFDKTNASASLFPTSPATSVTGSVLVRMVNAGLRMHVPSIVRAETTGSSVPGFSLIAEDGNPLPGIPRVQSEVFMAAGKTYDVMINAVNVNGNKDALPVFDRQLSLSGNAVSRDAGMVGYISVNAGGLPADPAFTAGAVVQDDTYTSVLPCPSSASSCTALNVLDPFKGVMANDTNVYGVTLKTNPTKGKVTLNSNGTFTYSPNPGWSSSDSDTFTYQATNGSQPTATVTLAAAPIEAGTGIICSNTSFNSTVAKSLSIKPPGILLFCKDSAGYPLTVAPGTVTPSGSGWTVSADPNGGFKATVPGTGTYTFTFKAQNSQGTVSASTAMVTLNFPQGSGLKVTVLDGANKTTVIGDYRWIIEEDRTFYVDPSKQTNTDGSGTATNTPVFGTNFHTSHMPLVATGCTGPLSCESGQTLLGNQKVVCDVGNGVCRPDATGNGEAPTDPGDVYLDPTKRYYISVLPGDAANPFIGGTASAPTNCDAGPYNSDGSLNTNCGHGMGGAPIAAAQTSVTVLSQPTPFPPAKLSVFVFEDDYPLNGEQDAGGGIDVLSPNEPGLGSFQITLFDDAGGTGDATGQPTYDMFNMPLSNSLAGTIDPTTGQDACPITKNDATVGGDGTKGTLGITGMIVTCPKYEADGKTLSPLAGQAVVANLYQGRYGVVATPAADRIGRGEEWLQTNTLDGQKAHDSFMRIGEPGYFQEFGPAGYHVSIGFANPKVINDRGDTLCKAAGSDCTHSVKGMVSMVHMSRTPDERLYGTGSRDAFGFTQCYVSLGDPEGADFRFTKCDQDGNFSFNDIPPGDWKVAIFDQWNDQIVDGISTPVRVCATGSTTCTDTGDMGEIAVNQWQSNISTQTFFDLDGNGLRGDKEPGLALVATNIRFRDGSFSNFNSTDLDGNAGFNEVFPLFNWYVVETDSTRYKNTGTHVVYDAGGPVDGTDACGKGGANCGAGAGTDGFAYNNYANTYEANPLPGNLHVPGAVYCNQADCSGQSIQDGPNPGSTPNSTGRIDPPWVSSYGWQGFAGEYSFLDFGKKPFAEGENGGIHGHVVYASTRPFDDPQLLLQLSWEPLVPNVTINLYQEGTAPDGSQSLILVDTTQTTSWDDWAQGFRSDGNPNMSCPGQSQSDPFYFSLKDQPNYLNQGTTRPDHSQFKCYDGMHNWNQLQPAPYDGMYSFPSMTVDPVSGKATATNCTICVPDPDATDPYRYGHADGKGHWDPTQGGAPMLPAGKYVVEIVVPSGYELVKEEDKNILIGDNFIAPVTQQFGGLGSIFILPDQAEVNAAYNAHNAQSPNTDQGRTTFASHESDTGSVETFWPCVGQSRTVPDFISLFPGSQEVAPFAGATRNLCDRKEVTLTDQTAALAKFYIFTSTHVASHFTGIITDDFTSEFDPFSPSFGEKFSPANLPVSIKDWAGNEISRVLSDQWGDYDGLTYSTWEVNPPNPTGYGPNTMIMCMNDAGTGTTPDPFYNPAYSQFCYEIPYMPGQTAYLDTPVIPTSAFSEGYNHPDCSYPDTTPGIKEVDGDGVGPWVSAPGNTLTITALGDQDVPNNAYTGPSATTKPFNQKNVTHHYGFGGTQGTVTIGGVTVPAANITSWDDSQIKLTVPAGIPPCRVQQQAQYGGSTAYCGELVITAANGKQSIDTVTVTVGGSHPKVLAAGQTIQSAIDAANPGDLIIVPPGMYKEMLLMWKPVRLQGVGAASSVISADAHPAGKLDPWRRQVACLFGLSLNGTPISGTNPYDSTGTFTCSSNMNFSVDRLPLEATVGWDATLNGNLAEMLQEPTLMGAYEGAGITVLAKGVKFPDPSQAFASDVFPTGTTLLTGTVSSSGTYNTGDANPVCRPSSRNPTNPFPSNFQCNPSSIDGLTVTNSSQGGGGIFVHGWAHNIEIANNRVVNNQGTLSGGITIGQGEHPDLNVAGGTATTVPGSCQTSSVTNQGLPYCFNMHVSVHNNYVTNNSSEGDELFSSTPSGSGGVSFCSGSDYYLFGYNWVCGNMSTGDGAGVSHIGYSYNGDIEHNSILFNQSINPTIATNGGGLLVMGAPDLDPACGATTDQDCLDTTVAPSDGTGPDLTINANLIVGNAAEAGSGGGIRLQHVNGTDVINFPNGSATRSDPTGPWNHVLIKNNVITNNVAGWDGAGISLQDALNVDIVNNTIMDNDATASSGVLFNTLFAPLASSPGDNCVNPSNSSQSCPQVSGVASTHNGPNLTANLPSSITCPAGHGPGGTGMGGLVNGACKKASYPALYNNVIWENRSFFIGVGGFGDAAKNQNQQHVVTLFNAFGSTPAPNQPKDAAVTPNGNGSIITGGTGACPTPASYWDVGVRGDLGPNDHSSGVTLAPTYSVLTDASDYASLNNTGSDPTVKSQYCNGSRVPPELGAAGYQVPPGTNESNVPMLVFTLTPSATVDEGNNWINMQWGPLSLMNSLTQGSDGNYGGASLGDATPATGSPAIGYVTTSSPTYAAAPSDDFFGNPRKINNANVSAGAIEAPVGTPPTLSTISPNSGARGTRVAVTLTGTNFTSATSVAISPNTGITISGVTVSGTNQVTATFTITSAATAGAKSVTVATSGGSSNPLTFTVTNPGAPTLGSISPNTGARGTTVPVTFTGTNFTLGSTITVAPGSGITVNSINVVNTTTITANFVITNGASLSARTVRVNSLGGTSNGVTFTVQGPTLSSVSPNTGARGTNVNVTLTGANFPTTGTTTVTISGTGVSASSVTVTSSTTITATFNITNSAARTTRAVTVHTPAGNTNTVPFTVQ
ncbi:MAG TPA: Ig-like domain-containing protein [Terriglobales bacterium]|nr:Ig-like domain-containing protein [Terriglobales bacterium]